jgi:hypothetical protein
VPSLPGLSPWRTWRAPAGLILRGYPTCDRAKPGKAPSVRWRRWMLARIRSACHLPGIGQLARTSSRAFRALHPRQSCAVFCTPTSLRSTCDPSCLASSSWRDGARSIAKRIHVVLSAPFDLGAHRVEIGTSISRPDELIKRADDAFDRTKPEGGDFFSFFELAMEGCRPAENAWCLLGANAAWGPQPATPGNVGLQVWVVGEAFAGLTSYLLDLARPRSHSSRSSGRFSGRF